MDIIPKGSYLVVFIVCDSEEYTGYDSKAWLSLTWSEALNSIDEFLYSGDFIPEIDSRFEIFDDQMNPSGQQAILQSMMDEAYDNIERERSDPESEYYTGIPSDQGTARLDPGTEQEAKVRVEKKEVKEVKEVKFGGTGEIKIEDTR